MKHLILVLLTLSVFSAKSKAQEASVEKSLWGIQIGISPLAIYNEAKLTNSIALRSELGFGFGWAGGYSGDSYQWAIIPIINIEPRYYYNLKKRVEKGKQIDGNSGNYLSLSFSYQPSVGITSKNTNLVSSIYIIPMYGIRRNISKRFNYELAFGIGYNWIFKEYTFVDYSTNTKSTHHKTEHDIAYGVRLAIGYKF